MSQSRVLTEGDLRARGYRITPQRERILKIFQDLPVGTHLSAEDLHQKLMTEAPKISLATTYRTLKLLASLGFLREVDFSEGHRHYELHRAETPHQHLICIKCGATVEFSGQDIDAAAQAKARQCGFLPLDVEIKILGICPTCQQKSAKS